MQNVYYSDVTISNSDAGVMIKSYPNCAGTVNNITYTGFTLVRLHYCGVLGYTMRWVDDGLSERCCVPHW